MLVTYPDTPTYKHICGTVADTPTCIHNALHLLGGIAPFREHCTSSEGVSYSLNGVTPPTNKDFRGLMAYHTQLGQFNATNYQGLSRSLRKIPAPNGGFCTTRGSDTPATHAPRPPCSANPHCRPVKAAAARQPDRHSEQIPTAGHYLDG